jgi:hypothetical protein
MLQKLTAMEQTIPGTQLADFLRALLLTFPE